MKPPQGPTSALGYLHDIILTCAMQQQKKKKGLCHELSVIFSAEGTCMQTPELKLVLQRELDKIHLLRKV